MYPDHEEGILNLECRFDEITMAWKSKVCKGHSQWPSRSLQDYSTSTSISLVNQALIFHKHWGDLEVLETRCIPEVQILSMDD